jgi:hypothetical protein
MSEYYSDSYCPFDSSIYTKALYDELCEYALIAKNNIDSAFAKRHLF